MEAGWSIVQSLITAASGLGGVWLGGWLTNKREATREESRVTKESNYLAILVSAHLDRFVTRCIEVAYDDGTSEGRPAGRDGDYHTATVSPPSFDPLALEVDWKVLPPDLMHGILNLPYRQEQLSHHLAGVQEYDDPPEYIEFFWARQRGYAILGLEVSALSGRLRRHACLPSETPIGGEQDRDYLLKRKREEIEAAYEAYHERLSAAAPMP